jgi:serine/threonine protein kinase
MNLKTSLTKQQDIKLDNIFCNYGEGDIRFSHIRLGDLGGACPVDSAYAKEGNPIGAPMWSSPEVIMETPWNTATDIWSFGTMVYSKKNNSSLLDDDANVVNPSRSLSVLYMVEILISFVLKLYHMATKIIH